MKKEITDYLIKEGFELVDTPDNSKEYFMFNAPKNDAGFDDVIVNNPNEVILQIGSAVKDIDELEDIIQDMQLDINFFTLYIKRLSENSISCIINKY